MPLLGSPIGRPSFFQSFECIDLFKANPEISKKLVFSFLTHLIGLRESSFNAKYSSNTKWGKNLWNSILLGSSYIRHIVLLLDLVKRKGHWFLSLLPTLTKSRVQISLAKTSKCFCTLYVKKWKEETNFGWKVLHGTIPEWWEKPMVWFSMTQTLGYWAHHDI